MSLEPAQPRMITDDNNIWLGFIRPYMMNSKSWENFIGRVTYAYGRLLQDLESMAASETRGTMTMSLLDWKGKEIPGTRQQVLGLFRKMPNGQEFWPDTGTVFTADRAMQVSAVALWIDGFPHPVMTWSTERLVGRTEHNMIEGDTLTLEKVDWSPMFSLRL